MTDQRARLLVGLAILAPAVPLVAALLARRSPVWVPDLDLALTELRVRDVGGPHTPLIGLPGRIGTLERPGSHPGPISFYLLAPGYRLLGSSSGSLQAATVMLHLTGAALTVGLVARRAGLRAACVTSALLVALVTALGPNVFTEPWNPHLPLLWWSTFLVAAWIALSGDATSLPVLALAGALCAQTHVPYLAPVGVITVVSVVVCLGWPERARAWRWTAAALVLALVAWAPPLLDQLRHDPGNLGVIVEHAQDPPSSPVGWGEGTRLALERLDLVQAGRAVTDPGLLTRQDAPGASSLRGAALLAAAAVVGVVRLRRAPREERALVGLAGLGATLLVVSVARIPGFPWTYLMLWGWTIALLLAWGTVSAVVRLARVRIEGWTRPAAALAASVALLLLAWGGRAGSQAELTNPVVSRAVRALVPDVIGEVARDDRYVVTWQDAVHLGGNGYGMYLELERRDRDVLVAPSLAAGFGQHRAAGGERVDGQLVVASGAAIADWDAEPDARRIANVDVRTPTERADAQRIEEDLVDVLRRTGRTDLVATVRAGGALQVAVDAAIDPAARRLALHLDALGAPVAVYLMDDR